MWINYNSAILEFYDRHPASCLLVESRAVAHQPAQLIDALRNKFGLRLGPPANLYDESLMHEGTVAHQAQLKHFFPEAIDLYQQLRERAAAAEPPEAPLDSALTATDWAFQDWVDLRHLEKQKKAAEVEWATQLEGARRTELQQGEAARATVLQEKQLAEAGRAQTLVDLEAERATRVRAEQEAQALRTRLGDKEGELQDARQRLEAARAHQTWMEGSKFWKLRRLWLCLRHPLLQRNL